MPWLVAFCLSTAGGVVFAKLLNLVLQAEKNNPVSGQPGFCRADGRTCGTVIRLRQNNGRVNPLMAAMGPNVAGVVGSAVTAGVFDPDRSVLK